MSDGGNLQNPARHVRPRRRLFQTQPLADRFQVKMRPPIGTARESPVAEEEEATRFSAMHHCVHRGGERRVSQPIPVGRFQLSTGLRSCADECCAVSRLSSVAQFLSPPVSILHWIDATISELRLGVEFGDDLFGSVLAALQLIQLTGERLRGFALLCGIRSFINLLILNLATKLRRRMSLIFLDSCRRLDATFPENSNSLPHLYPISCAVAMH
jgi:hypothetical protein